MVASLEKILIVGVKQGGVLRLSLFNVYDLANRLNQQRVFRILFNKLRGTVTNGD